MCTWLVLISLDLSLITPLWQVASNLGLGIFPFVDYQFDIC